MPLRALWAADPDLSAPGQTHLHQADNVKIIGRSDGAGCDPCQRGHTCASACCVAATQKTATNAALDAAGCCLNLAPRRSNWQLMERGRRGAAAPGCSKGVEVLVILLFCSLCLEQQGGQGQGAIGACARVCVCGGGSSRWCIELSLWCTYLTVTQQTSSNSQQHTPTAWPSCLIQAGLPSRSSQRPTLPHTKVTAKKLEYGTTSHCPTRLQKTTCGHRQSVSGPAALLAPDSRRRSSVQLLHATDTLQRVVDCNIATVPRKRHGRCVGCWYKQAPWLVL